jgi:hypothetical protein
MNLTHCPISAAVVAQQRNQDLRNEAQRLHMARVAASAIKASTGERWTQLKGVAASIRSDSAHRLSRAARRIEIWLSAWRTTASEA